MKNIVLTLFCLLTATLTGCHKTKLLSADNDGGGGGGGGTTANVSASPSTQTPATETRQFRPSDDAGGASETDKLTGTYEYKAGSRANEIKVLELGGGMLKVSFLGNAEFDSQVGPMANSGEIAATKIRLKGNKAVLTPEDSPRCRITLVFGTNRLEVEQNEHDCGLPSGVLADGDYSKTSGKPPAFDEESINSPPDAAAPEKQAGNVSQQE